MSQSNRPLLHEVIPVIDKLYSMLKKASKNTDLDPVVRAAARRGRVMLNKYYSATDDSIMYRAAMSKCAACLRYYLN